MTGTVYITDGTKRIDLNNCGRIYIRDWTPFVPGPKGNGTWRESSLSPGRQLVDWQWENWVDVFALGMHNVTQDRVIREEQELQRLLVKAHQYWTTDWQNEPVWLEVRAPCETNTRYAVIKSWRTPVGSGNPFQQPFSTIGQQKSVIDNFQLTVEHGPWLSDQPGTGRCVPISGSQESGGLPVVEFDGADTNINCGNDIALADLPTTDYTAEAWVRADDWGESNEGIIFGKTNWRLSIGLAYGVRAWADFQTVDAESNSNFTPDGEWHHIAITFTGTTTDTYRIWVDGAESSYSVQQAGTGGYVFGGDTASNLYIGNESTLLNTWDGAIGWTRLSDTIRYTADFTPPPLCKLPAIDGNTIAQWIGAERSGVTIDNQEGTALLDGTLTDGTFGDAECEFGREETCLDEVYIANKHNQAQLTHIFVDDGGAFGTNLLNDALPYLFLPAIPAVNDAVYFGIDTTLDDSGPFCSLVFDILTAITDVTSIAWEYWNGAWVALTVQDNTNADGAMTGVAFDTANVNSVHWEQPSDWATTAVNGVTGYWVRARVTAIGAAPIGPFQQNRDIYSILWPYVEIDDSRVLGDINATALADAVYQSLSSGDDIAHMVVGLRSLSRGDDFSAFINCADEQNNIGITVSTGVAASIANRVQSPTGRAVLWNPAGVVGAPSEIVRITFADVLSLQYIGMFRVFTRAVRVSGSSGDFEIQLRTDFGGLVEGEFVSITLTNEYTVYDLGMFTLGQGNESYNDPTISIYGTNSNAAPGDLYIYDVILIPVDEMAIDATWLGGSNDRIEWGRYLSIDSITYPKTQIRSILRQASDDTIDSSWLSITANALHLQSNANQRLWFFVYGPSNDVPLGSISQSYTIQMLQNYRYLYARGDR